LTVLHDQEGRSRLADLVDGGEEGVDLGGEGFLDLWISLLGAETGQGQE